MRVIVVRHNSDDSAGFIAAAFAARGAELIGHLFPNDGPLPSLDDADHVVVLGAFPSVYDKGPARSWITQELDWLRHADEMGIPVFGICFGAQALCAALGGQVVKAERDEVGWTVIDSADPFLIPVGPWLQFHGDRCELPAHAKILATNAVGVQAFSIGRHLAVQFHPEVDGEALGLWLLDARGRAKTLRAGIDPDRFLMQTVAEEAAAMSRAQVLVDTALRLAEASQAGVGR